MEKRATGSTNQNEARISINRGSAPKETRRKIGRTFTCFKRQDRSAVIPVSETFSLDLNRSETWRLALRHKGLTSRQRRDLSHH